MIRRKQKYICYFVSSASGIPRVEKIKRISISSDFVNFDKNIGHSIDIDNPTFTLKNMLIYVVDIRDGLISFDKNKTTVDIQLVNRIVKQKIISQLTKSMENKVNWFNIILSLGFGAGIGLFIGYMLGGNI